MPSFDRPVKIELYREPTQEEPNNAVLVKTIDAWAIRQGAGRSGDQVDQSVSIFGGFSIVVRYTDELASWPLRAPRPADRVLMRIVDEFGVRYDVQARGIFNERRRYIGFAVANVPFVI